MQYHLSPVKLIERRIERVFSFRIHRDNNTRTAAVQKSNGEKYRGYTSTWRRCSCKNSVALPDTCFLPRRLMWRQATEIEASPSPTFPRLCNAIMWRVKSFGLARSILSCLNRPQRSHSFCNFLQMRLLTQWEGAHNNAITVLKNFTLEFATMPVEIVNTW